MLGASAVNETRFQYFRAGGANTPRTSAPAIQVLGAFSAGGAPIGRSFDTQNSYEFQNYTSLARGAHAWRFGVRLRGQTIDDTSPQNFAGTFTFGGGEVTSIERYRRTLLYTRLGFAPARIRALGGGATQFSVNAGVPSLSAGQMDAGLFVGDDWRVRPNLSLSLGLRYETQSNLHGRRDFAPRAGLAWAPGAKGKNRPRTVLRAGFGMFYDRFALANILAARRYNGLVQQQYTIADPDFFPNVPPLAALAGLPVTRTVQQLAPTLRAPYLMQSAAAVERQLPFNTTVAVTYANTHGLHILRSGVLPGPVFEMESSGLYNQSQLITNVNAKVNARISLFGSYIYNQARSNTDGLSTFPANPLAPAGEYGPAATDIHHRVSLGGSLEAPWGIRLNPLLVVDSGPPFDITVGRDLYGTTLFNGRPGIATDPARPGLVRTRYGLLDPNPTPRRKRCCRATTAAARARWR